MRVANMARDEKIDKILESISRIETMMTQLNLNNDFKTPTKFSSQKRHPFPNRLKAKSSDIDIHTTISDDEDDLIELDKGSFTHDDAFNIKINIDKPVFPTVRAAMKKKNISKGKTIMGIQKKLPFTLPGGVRKPKIEPKSFNKFKCEFMPTPTMRLLKDQIKACVYAFSASLDSSEKLVVTDTIRATRSDFDHFVPDRPIIDKILELVSLRCTDEQSDINFKTTWQLPSRFVANVLEHIIMSNFYKDDGIQEYNKQFHDYKIKRVEDMPQCIVQAGTLQLG
ncbi:Ulp1 protease family, carboxy-terminal domain protein [Arachis hypogaea]|nr:Ulp1 protease family, carboxy-terminal domain protein [Arachis hypogaea]